MSVIMVLSAVFLAMGGLILRTENLVPEILTYSTVGTIALILVIAYFINAGKPWATHVGLVLGIFSILFNLSQPSHTNAILHPVMTAPFLILVASEILGFFIFPAVFIIIYMVNFRKITGKN